MRHQGFLGLCHQDRGGPALRFMGEGMEVVHLHSWVRKTGAARAEVLKVTSVGPRMLSEEWPDARTGPSRAASETLMMWTNIKKPSERSKILLPALGKIHFTVYSQNSTCLPSVALLKAVKSSRVTAPNGICVEEES